MDRHSRILLALALLSLTGCASVKPSIRCDLDGHAEVYQGVLGIGVGQRLAEADELCLSIGMPRPTAAPETK